MGSNTADASVQGFSENAVSWLFNIYKLNKQHPRVWLLAMVSFNSDLQIHVYDIFLYQDLKHVPLKIVTHGFYFYYRIDCNVCNIK